VILLRNVVAMVADLARYGARSGRWWVAVTIVAFTVAAALVATAKVVVPTAVYVLF
jgi:hypothetical protein